jgi:O-antigen ligase
VAETVTMVSSVAAPVERRLRRVSRAASFVVGSTLLLVAWGAFAFGSVYAWAYTPLVIGSIVVGLLGCVTGGRPLWSANRILLLALGGIGAVAAVQLIPWSIPTLARISPATVRFLQQYDFRFSIDPEGLGSASGELRHAISVAPSNTVRFLWLFAGPLVLFAGLMRSLSRTAALRLARGIVFVGLALAVFAILQKALLGDQAFSGMKIYGFWRPESLLTTPYGPFVNKNHFAGWMLMGVPVALGLAIAHGAGETPTTPKSLSSLLVWLSEPTGGRFLVYIVAAVIMGLSLVMAGSRSGIACFAAAVCGAAAWTARGRSRRVTIGALVAALALVVIALQWAGSDAALQRFGDGGESLHLRLDVWRLSTDLVKSFPVLGTGMDTFGTAMVVYQPPSPLRYNEAHNDYLQLLVEGGVVTFVLVVIAIGSVVLAISGRFRTGVDGPQARWVRVGAATGLAAIALQSLVEFSLQMPGNATLFAVLLALALYVPAPVAQR